MHRAAAIRDSTRLVAKNAAARPAVTRVRKLAAPRPVMNPPASAAADAERPALRALQQHDADQRQRDHEMDDEQDGGHATLSRGLSVVGGFYTSSAGRQPLQSRASMLGAKLITWPARSGR